MEGCKGQTDGGRRKKEEQSATYDKPRGDGDVPEQGKDRYRDRPGSGKSGKGDRPDRTGWDKPRYSDRPDRRSDRGDRRGKGDMADRQSGPPDRDGKAVRSDKRLSKPTVRDSKPSARTEEESKAQREENERKKKEAAKLKEEEEAKRKEEEAKEMEERKKQEEIERQMREEEAKKKAEEEAARLEAEEEQSLKDFVLETQERIREKEESRKKNLNAADHRPDEAFFSKLDSNLKRNTAFVKKLRNLTESQREALCKELTGLNLTRYVGEVASAIVDAKLKMSDVPCAVHICSLLHIRYADFSHSVMEAFNKYLLTKKEEKIGNASKYRVDLRFLGELVASGVFTAKEGLPVLANQLSILVHWDREEHNYLAILTSFCRHCGQDYMGTLPRKYRVLSEKYKMEIPKSQLLVRERQKGCRNLMKEYYASLVKHLVLDHKDLKGLERVNRKLMQSKGEIPTDRKEAYENSYAVFHKLQTSTAVFADLLDEDMPEFPQEELNDETGGGLDIFNPLKDSEFQYEGDKTLFEDDDTRSFYETLPDLKAFIPGILYRDSENASAKDDLKSADTGLEEEITQLAVDDIEKELETEQIEENMKEAERQEGGGGDELPEGGEKLLMPEPEDDDTETGSLMRAQFDSFLSSLPNCVNRDMMDSAAVEFCMNFNTKANRKKLAKTLFTVHRTRYDLLPFYSRLVAILEPCMPELSCDLVQMLKVDFKWHVRKKDQINVETKLKIVRFIGELVKFKVCPKTEALQCLKMLMFDFRHHNIEMACALLETCGRFLYRSPESHYRTKIYLEVMMRKKVALTLDTRYETMIENAFYYSNPPEVQPVQRKERPPMHEYIRRLLYKDLSKVTTEKVLRQMRKLQWDDPEIAFYATKCLAGVWNIRYNSIHCAANLLAGIAPYHEHVAIQVVDAVLEDIRLGMEMNHPRYNQRRVSCIKYLGELYNYRMVESSVVFKVLYSLITFGVSLDESQISPLDPPEHLFRLRLVCVALDTCGQFFDKGSSKKKLDCFLTYFQRYYWFKKKNAVFNPEHPFPIDIDNLMHETLEIVRPRLVQFQSHEEACQAAEDLENEYRAKIANVLTLVETEEDDDEEEDEEEEEDGLTTILEGDENEDLTLSGGAVEGSGTQESESSMTETEDVIEEGEGEGEGADEGDSSSDEFTDSDADDEDNDEVQVVMPKLIECQEDQDFMAALDQMMSDTIQARTQEPLKVPQLDIALPTQLKNKKKGMAHLTERASEDNRGLKFVLMTRRGNKQQLTDFEIPVTAEFATKFKEREEAERMEKEKMKQMVLNLNERQEEEEYQETLANLNRVPTTNVNRERKVRYQHPKGAPDADLIFGSKSAKR